MESERLRLSLPVPANSVPTFALTKIEGFHVVGRGCIWCRQSLTEPYIPNRESAQRNNKIEHRIKANCTGVVQIKRPIRIRAKYTADSAT